MHYPNQITGILLDILNGIVNECINCFIRNNRCCYVNTVSLLFLNCVTSRIFELNRDVPQWDSNGSLWLRLFLLAFSSEMHHSNTIRLCFQRCEGECSQPLKREIWNTTLFVIKPNKSLFHGNHIRVCSVYYVSV